MAVKKQTIHGKKSGYRLTGTPTMADAEEFEKTMEEWARKHTRTKEAARKKMVQLGILTPAGRLTKKYSS